MEFNVRHAEFETLNGRPEFKKKKNVITSWIYRPGKLRKIWIGKVK